MKKIAILALFISLFSNLVFAAGSSKLDRQASITLQDNVRVSSVGEDMAFGTWMVPIDRSVIEIDHTGGISLVQGTSTSQVAGSGHAPASFVINSTLAREFTVSFDAKPNASGLELTGFNIYEILDTDLESGDPSVSLLPKEEARFDQSTSLRFKLGAKLTIPANVPAEPHIMDYTLNLNWN